MQITAMTPQQIDTTLAGLDRELASAEQGVIGAEDNLHRALGERPLSHYGGRPTWRTTTEEAVVKATALVQAPGYVEPTAISWQLSPAKALKRYQDAVAKAQAIAARMKPLDDEFTRRGGWSRFFTVQQHNGHIHRSQWCSTCNKGRQRTRFAWNPELSGLSEAEAMAVLGRHAHVLCTVCFPNAPVEWTTRPEKPSCSGTGQAPVRGSGYRVGMRWYGRCTGCGHNHLTTQSGGVRKHPPVEQPAKV